jgi:uncharacterized metal-binding protein
MAGHDPTTAQKVVFGTISRCFFKPLKLLWQKLFRHKKVIARGLAFVGTFLSLFFLGFWGMVCFLLGLVFGGLLLYFSNDLPND